MPRTLSIDPRVPALHGNLIPREAVDEYARAYTTVHEARAHARRIIKKAQLTACSIEQQAMHEGFQAGWRDSLDAIYGALSGKEQFFRQIEAAVKQSVQRELETALQAPGLELHLLEGWLAGATREVSQLQIILPRAAAAQAGAIQRRVTEALGTGAAISVGETDSMIIQSGDQVFEFSPKRTFVELCNLAQQCFQRLEVKKLTTVWSEETAAQWLANLQQRLGQTNVRPETIAAGFDERFFDEIDDDFEEATFDDVAE